MVMDALRGYIQLASGVTEMSRQRATAVAKAMLSSPEATREQVSALAAEVMEASKTNRDAVTVLVKAEVDRALGRLGLAAAEEVTALAGRVSALEAEVRALRAAAAEHAQHPTVDQAPPASRARRAAPRTSAGTGTAGAARRRTPRASTGAAGQPRKAGPVTSDAGAGGDAGSGTDPQPT